MLKIFTFIPIIFYNYEISQKQRHFAAPASLPGQFGIGTFGDEAFEFVDFLEKAGQKLWQILPLGPTGFGNSPYQCFSSAAGNPLLISPEKLVQSGLLNKKRFKRY